MRQNLLLFLIICIHVAVNAQQSFSWSNPIRFQDAAGSLLDEVRDPCIFREGDTYYLVHTMFPFTHSLSRDSLQPDYNSSPGIRMYESKDLKDWKPSKTSLKDGWLVKSSLLPDSCAYKHRFWAPEIHKIKNKFYLLFTASNWVSNNYNPTNNMDDLNAFIGVSDQITGPYEHITYIPGGACDLTIMEDSTSGNVYAYIPGMDVFVQQIELGRLEQGQVSLVGERKKIVTAKNDDIGLDWNYKYLEGPYAFNQNGKYYLFFAGLRKDGVLQTGFDSNEGYEYWSGVAYADNPMGPFRKMPAGKAFWGGHLTVFQGPCNRYWFAYRGEKWKDTQGFLCIDPFEIAPVDKSLRFKAPSHTIQKISSK